MGEGGVGKTALVTKYTTGRFDGKKYLPTIGDMYRKDTEIAGLPRSLILDDTAGQAAYSDLRDALFGTGDAYILAYGINDDVSFERLDELRDAILRAQDKPVPIFLVGTKSDLEGERAVTRAEANAKAAKWGGGTMVFETSAKTGENVEEVFETAATRVLETTTDSTKGSGGGSLFAGGKASVTPETEAAAEAKASRPCSIL